MDHDLLLAARHIKRQDIQEKHAAQHEDGQNNTYDIDEALSFMAYEGNIGYAQAAREQQNERKRDHHVIPRRITQNIKYEVRPEKCRILKEPLQHHDKCYND